MELKTFVFIYGLAEPDTMEIRYVGQTFRPHYRFKGHTAESVQTSRKVRVWVAELKAVGKLPVMVVFEKVPVAKGAKREQAAINKFRRKNALGCTGGRDRQPSTKYHVQGCTIRPPRIAIDTPTEVLAAYWAKKDAEAAAEEARAERRKKKASQSKL